MNTISRFRGEYRFLSNFYEASFEFEGVRYPTVEHAYQSMKTLDPERRRVILAAKGAPEAAKLGRAKATVLRDGWLDGLKGDVMRPLVFAKFEQNPELAERLLATGDALLVEGNYWHDNYFGICSCRDCFGGDQPKNVLGEILMAVRESLRRPKS